MAARRSSVPTDRHQQRAKAKMEQALSGAQQRVDKKTEVVQAQRAKLAESEARGHGKLLVKRQAKLADVEQDLHVLEHTRDQRHEHLTALAPIGERAEGNFRKQTIMTIRTLFLENALLAFLAVLVGHMHAALSLECLLTLLFERSGARVETRAQIIY